MGHLPLLKNCEDWSGDLDRINTIIKNALADLCAEDRIRFLNDVKIIVHESGPFKDEPVDCVIWVPTDDIEANDYNPNKVAPPEMRLLEHSILSDGYTQPVVTWLHPDGGREIIDGFHRSRVGRESKAVRARVQGYLPVTTANQSRTERGDRIAATIRHNRARGKHQIQAMSDIVVELTRRNWSDSRIAKELGMDADEVLRLKQITGLAELFADREFSEAWEIPVDSDIDHNEPGLADQ